MTPIQRVALEQLGAIRERDTAYRGSKTLRIGPTSNASRAAWDRALLIEVIDALTHALTEQNRLALGIETPHG